MRLVWNNPNANGESLRAACKGDAKYNDSRIKYDARAKRRRLTMKQESKELIALRKKLALVPKSMHKKIVLNSIRLRRLKAERDSLLKAQQKQD
jgi:hypothetical protein